MPNVILLSHYVANIFFKYYCLPFCCSVSRFQSSPNMFTFNTILKKLSQCYLSTYFIQIISQFNFLYLYINFI